MDVITAISTATEALKGIKQIRDFDRALSEAELKSKMADLYVQVSDLKIALADQRELLCGKEEEIAALNMKISTLQSGESCPLCRKGSLEVAQVRPHPQFGVLGHQLHTLRCNNQDCRHTESRKHVPNG